MANIERVNYFKTIRDPKELDEIPTDVLKELYLQTVTDLDEFKKDSKQTINEVENAAENVKEGVENNGKKE